MSTQVDLEQRPLFTDIPGFSGMSGIPPTTIQKEIAAGNIVAVKHGKRIRIDVDASLAWLRGLPAAKKTA